MLQRGGGTMWSACGLWPGKTPQGSRAVQLLGVRLRGAGAHQLGVLTQLLHRSAPLLLWLLMQLLQVAAVLPRVLQPSVPMLAQLRLRRAPHCSSQQLVGPPLQVRMPPQAAHIRGPPAGAKPAAARVVTVVAMAVIMVQRREPKAKPYLGCCVQWTLWAGQFCWGW